MNRLLGLPRVPLATLPTPLHPAPRLSEAIGVEVWLKRDDLTGLGLGGNKVRGLEYLIGDALAQGCDCLVTGAGPQSNWAMLSALAARRCGLDPHLVFYGSPVSPTGNLLLDELIGAEVHYTGEPDRTSVDAGIEALAEKLRAAGRRPYILPRGGATALGSAGYLRASLELAGQLVDSCLAPAQLWLASGSCGTQAGLVAGARWLRTPYEVIGVSVSRPEEECTHRVRALAEDAAELLGLPGNDPTGTAEDVTVLGGHIGPGYGKPSEEGAAAAELVARTEGVFLDPVFAAKAMGALLRSAPAGPVVFLVSGGTPTLFAARKESM
ncbi:MULTISPECIES: 1-aminocyclopropane-1-carboxylate deaminase/D-cysteine desulfhydrase [Mycolicibacterium]|uniref:1-aminocyclopropane-1-carboxylate deaminase n=1 Tax=Mycolicibacterium rhodesiae (strain NBB3) TaxID=710685 RepID=G8RJA1_MYCRN|nr:MULTISPECIES: D-cysteine desulfhydrase family protein [Mycolicibacterium]AEV73471.1 1-aminocyclopropane-1-carboxylate deaminase [Mycolicibacterium rhodesiae NBB3]